MALQDFWLEGIDVDAALYDVRDDDAQAWEVRALAGASIGIDAIAGFRAVLELCEAINRIVLAATVTIISVASGTPSQVAIRWRWRRRSVNSRS